MLRLLRRTPGRRRRRAHHRQGQRAHHLRSQKFPGKRLHVRAIVRDGTRAFVGSQSLRALELDRRREVGLFVHETPVVKRIAAVFEQDWAAIETGRKTADAAKDAEPARPDAAADVTDDVA